MTLTTTEIRTDLLQETSIGTLLQRAGKLSESDFDRILELQGRANLLFGEAAVQLGLLTEEDVQWALASQYSYPYVRQGQTGIAHEVLAIHEPFSLQVEALRSIRSGLVLSGAGRQFKVLAVVSPDSGEGRTFIAANLAAVFAQSGSRTLLADLNFRSSRIHELFSIRNKTGISSLLIHRATTEQAIMSTPLAHLAVLPSGPKPPNPLELLGWPDTRDLIATLSEEYDVIIIDTPPALATADALMITALCDAAVLVAMKGVTRTSALLQLKKRFAESGMHLLGTVLNEHRLPQPPAEKWSAGRIRRMAFSAVRRIRKLRPGSSA